jgi:hypothetical protein
LSSNGRRHRLILYTYVIDRWWQAILITGLVLLVVVLCFAVLPRYLPQYPIMEIGNQELWAVGGIGVLAICLATFLFAVRKSAYVQPFRDHIRLVTPFLRLNIAYQRIRKTSATEMGQLFPRAIAKGWQRAFMRPLASQLAVVLDLNGFPIAPFFLRLFLSPFFFPDKTARIVLLVPDWMVFSTEIESLRSTWVTSVRPAGYSDAAKLVPRAKPKG